MMWAIAWLAACTCAPTDPWDDPEFVRKLDLQELTIEDIEAHYSQLSRVFGCTVSGRFYDEPRPKAVSLILDQIRSAEHPEHCAASTRLTFYMVCDFLCSSNPDFGGFAPCDDAALSSLPDGCQWIGWEQAPDYARSLAPGPRWLDRPFPWGPGVPWDGRHPAEIAEHYADHGQLQALLRAHEAARKTP